MSWFDRCVGDGSPEEAWEKLNGAVQRSGLATALASACGRRGLRCFVVLFEVRGGRTRLAGLSSEPLRQGGGPPPPAAFDAAAPAIEAGLDELPRLLGPRFRFERGAVGVLRDGKGQLDFRFRFDEDAQGWGLAQLRAPEGDPHPLEDPAYLLSIRNWDSRIDRMRSRWEVAREGEAWSFTDARLHVGRSTPRPGEAMATWTPKNERFEWLLAEPAAEESPFVEPVLAVTLAEAVELIAFAAARRRDASVFQGATEDGTVVFIGLRS